MEQKDKELETEKKMPKMAFGLVVFCKIVVYIFLMLLIGGILAGISAALLDSKDYYFQRFQGQICLLIGSFLAAYILLKSFGCMKFAEMGFSLRGRGKDIFLGMVAALIIYSLGFGLLLALGEVAVVSMHFSAKDLLLSWVLMLLVSLTEEVAFRGYVLGSMLNEGINRYAALIISSVLFSLLHLFNPNFSFVAFLNIFLAGMMLGSTYIYTRNLWFPISLHLFWNWLQGPVLGMEVSGTQAGNTLLQLRLSEHNLINGGAFGFEGSLLCTALEVIAIIVILRLASKQSSCELSPH